MQVITPEAIKGLRGMELIVIFPDVEMDGSEGPWDRQYCKAYVADADIEKGITIRGEDPDSSTEEDVELYCLNKDDRVKDFSRGKEPYRVALANMYLAIHSGVHDRHNVDDDYVFGSMVDCAFG